MTLSDGSAVLTHIAHPPGPLHPLLVGTRHREKSDTAHSVDSAIQEAAIGGLTYAAVAWDRVKVTTANDRDMQLLAQLVEEGNMPEHKKELPDSLKPYYRFRDELITIDGVILHKERIVHPPKLLPAVLAALHATCQVVQAMIAWADSSVF